MIGSIIKTARLNLGIKASEMARLIGEEQGLLRRVEFDGKVPPNVEFVKRVARVLRLDVNDMVKIYLEERETVKNGKNRI